MRKINGIFWILIWNSEKGKQYVTDEFSGNPRFLEAKRFNSLSDAIDYRMLHWKEHNVESKCVTWEYDLDR